MRKLILENFLPYRLNSLAALVSRDFHRVYSPHHDLTVPEWRVLATLGEFAAMTAKAIGSHSAMHKTKVSRAIQALEKRRWLTRQTNSTDRREEILSLTALGRRTYADIVPRALDFEEKILAKLGEHRHEVLELLSRLGMAASGPTRRS